MSVSKRLKMCLAWHGKAATAAKSNAAGACEPRDLEPANNWNSIVCPGLFYLLPDTRRPCQRREYSPFRIFFDISILKPHSLLRTSNSPTTSTMAASACSISVPRVQCSAMLISYYRSPGYRSYERLVAWLVAWLTNCV